MTQFGRLLALNLALMMLPACAGQVASIPAVTGTAPITSQTAIDEKAWYAAEALYNVPAQAYVAAVKADKMPASVRAIVKPKLQAMNRVRVAARTAYKLGDAATFSARVAELSRLRDDVITLIPKASLN